jgi:hypothetical protein
MRSFSRHIYKNIRFRVALIGSNRLFIIKTYNNGNYFVTWDGGGRREYDKDVIKRMFDEERWVKE